MKKSLSILLAVLMLLSTLSPFCALADSIQKTSGSCGDNATFELKNGVLTITGTGETTSKPWLEIGETTNINKVIIGEGITAVDERSFAKCVKLKEAVLPQSLTGIKKYTFFKCKSLEKADLPDNLKYVGMSAFQGCESLKKIDLPESVERIYSSAFNGCHCAKGKLYLRKNLFIELYAFNYCKSLEEIYFEDGFSMDNFTSTRPLKVFNYCEGVKKIYIPGSMKEMNSSLFSNCTSLTDVTISEGVETVTGFANCTALEKIVLPKSTKTIYNSAFYGCESLKTVKIQSKLSNIDEYVFYNCPNLKTLKIPYGVDSVGKRAFGYYETVDEVVENSEGSTKEIKSEHKVKNFKVYGKKCKALTDYCKDNDLKFIDMYDVGNATASPKSQTYTGKSIKASVTVKLAGITLKKDTDYTLKYANTVNVGTATVTITGIGKYKGTLVKTYKINPKPTEIKKVTAGKKSFKAYWKKRDVKTYQLQYSTYKSFKNGKKLTVKGTAKTVKNLKANKKYYVRVRTFKTIKGVKYYSKWSEAKTVKTK